MKAQWQSLPEVVRVHVADVDKIGCTKSVQRVRWRLMKKPPASGKGRTLQPRVEHEPRLSQLQLHAGVGKVRHLGERFVSLMVADVALLYKKHTHTLTSPSWSSRGSRGSASQGSMGFNSTNWSPPSSKISISVAKHARRFEGSFNVLTVLNLTEPKGKNLTWWVCLTFYLFLYLLFFFFLLWSCIVQSLTPLQHLLNRYDIMGKTCRQGCPLSHKAALFFHAVIH